MAKKNIGWIDTSNRCTLKNINQVIGQQKEKNL
jgi:hypothetical protein